MKFKNHKHKLARPFYVTADCECTLIKTNNSKKPHKHVVNSCGYYFVNTSDSSKNYLKRFNGSDCLREMIASLLELSGKCIQEMRKNEKMKLTREDWKRHDKAKKCYICSEAFDEGCKSKCKVRDHDHVTGKYRGPAHASCNINYFNNRYLPVFFHNLRGYDSHLILKEAAALGLSKIDAIPNNFEKFMCFSIGGKDQSVKFLDSKQFMNSSLEKLVDNLKDNDPELNNFPNMRKVFGNRVFGKDVKLMTQKGVYPYEWVDSMEKLNSFKGLPPQEAFFSSLRQEAITHEEYQHALKVYDDMKCQSFLDYHNLYLESDIVLLADVYESFRKKSMEIYGLDPTNYISAPGFSWDAMLLYTGVELELVHDPIILDILERHKRGGLCFVGTSRYAKAKNKYLDGNDDPQGSSAVRLAAIIVI